jgi:hypothetical protein
MVRGGKDSPGAMRFPIFLIGQKNDAGKPRILRQENAWQTESLLI